MTARRSSAKDAFWRGEFYQSLPDFSLLFRACRTASLVFVLPFLVLRLLSFFSVLILPYQERRPFGGRLTLWRSWSRFLLFRILVDLVRQGFLHFRFVDGCFFDLSDHRFRPFDPYCLNFGRR